MNKQRLKYTIAGVSSLLLVVCLYILFFAKKPPLKRALNIPESYLINLPETTTAGTKLCFGYAEWMQGCELIIENSWGVVLQNIEGKSGLCCLEDSTVRQTGLYDIHLNCGDKVVSSRQLIIKPLTPAEPLEVYLGSKSITADGGRHWAMITAIPVDSLQNPVMADTPVEFDFYRPNGNREAKLNQTAHMVAYEKIYSGLKVGKTIVGSKAGQAIGQEKMLLEEPGYPANFSIKSVRVYPFADSRQFFMVESSDIMDEFGNKVADGTLVNFRIVDSNGLQRQLTAYSIDGRVNLVVQNPESSGNMVITGAIFGNISSNELNVNFRQVVTELPVRFDESNQQLIIGPLVGPLGQYVADGSEVKVEFQPSVQRKLAVIINGSAKVSTKELPKGLYTISFKFGGLEKTIKFRK
jgi:hypothetical protein